MGITTALILRGEYHRNNMQNLLIASCLAVAASAEAFYGYQLPASGLATWPSTGNGYGASSTVYGAHGYRIGKRSADASYGYGIGYGIVLPTTLENRNDVHGHELASGYAISQPHPGAAGSFQQRTQLHSSYGKRSAEPFYGGVAVHPGHAVSSTHRSVQGLSLGYGYGHGYGYGKRSAEPFYGAAVTVENNNNLHGHELGSGYSISQPHPGHSGSSQHVSRVHSNILLPYSSGFGY